MKRSLSHLALRTDGRTLRLLFLLLTLVSLVLAGGAPADMGGPSGIPLP